MIHRLIANVHLHSFVSAFKLGTLNLHYIKNAIKASKWLDILEQLPVTSLFFHKPDYKQWKATSTIIPQCFVHRAHNFYIQPATSHQVLQALCF